MPLFNVTPGDLARIRLALGRDTTPPPPARRRPRGDGGGSFVIGKLDGSLSYQGSATLSVWYWNGSAYADTGTNLTVYDWLLSSGQTVASGVQVTASFDARSNRWFVTGAQCA